MQQRSLLRSIPLGHPTGYTFSDGYYASEGVGDPTMDDEPNVPNADDRVPVASSGGPANAGASSTNPGAPSRWGVETGRTLPQPFQGASVPLDDPRVTALRAVLQGLGVPVSPDITDIGQLLALASAQYPGSGNHTGGGPSNGLL
eukprot:TRINITY_DN1795_c0_g1_i1.p3 TRINITY_DN1795_c0_g1~~TRINITY_DN1795_c0_g1_i1.p3  ORF type:complete len:145 (-),score=10.39 TRINITY_DN1795_c0_g1_i1:1175-1609(-)